jgi:hypothetical protein
LSENESPSRLYYYADPVFYENNPQNMGAENNPLWWETKASKIWDGQTISKMNPRHHLHITETPTLTVVKIMTMSPLTNNQCMVFFKDSTGTFLELIHSGTHCITRQTDQESEEKHTTHW